MFTEDELQHIQFLICRDNNTLRDKLERSTITIGQIQLVKNEIKDNQRLLEKVKSIVPPVGLGMTGNLS